MIHPRSIKKSPGVRGFTIVELLIVIVVIAILAAISVVAYNGIQERARNSATQQAASQLERKVSAWYVVKGSFPSAADVAAGLSNTSVPEAKIDSSLGNVVITNAMPTKEKPVAYSTCAGYVGGKIRYFVEPSDIVLIERGDCP